MSESAFVRSMRAALLWLCVLSGCSDAAYPVPVIGTVGDLPPAASTVRVEIREHGDFVMDGARFESGCEPERLGRALDEASRGMGTREFAVGGTKAEVSAVNVLVRAHRDAPASSFLRLLSSCVIARPPLTRVFIEVRHPRGGPAGALAWFLPYDSGGHWPGGIAVPVELLLPAGARRLDAARVADRLRSILARNPDESGLAVRIVVAPGARMQLLLDGADATFRAGLAPVLEMPEDRRPDRLAMRVDQGSLELLPVDAGDAGLGPPRVEHGYAGITDSRRVPPDLLDVSGEKVDSPSARER